MSGAGRGLRPAWAAAALLAAVAGLALWRGLQDGDPLAEAVAAARAAPQDLARRWHAVDLALARGRLASALELIGLVPEPADLPGRGGDWQRLRARVLAAAGRWEEAAAAGWAASEQGPQRGETWRDLGQVLYGWFREALPGGVEGPGLPRLLGDARFALSTAARFAPRDPAIWLALGRVHATFGDAEKAREAFRKATALAGDEDRILLARMALVLLDDGIPWREAVAAAEHLAEGGGKGAWALLGGLYLDFFYDGVWQVGAGRRPLATAARACFRRAVEEQPGDAASWYRLGLTAANLGAREEAAESFRRASALAPRTVLASMAERSLEKLGG